MLSNLLQAFKTPDLRRKILFTLVIIIVFRLGSFVPTPGVDYTKVASCTASIESNDLLGLINLFSGGALLQLSVFALGIMPYITASIIVQMLRIVIPRFEALYKEGQAGQTKMTQYTRYLTVGLAILQSTTIITTARIGTLFGNAGGDCKQVIPDQSIPTLLVMIIVMTAGTSLIMWFGELVTERGVGNGMSVLIFTSICAKFLPSLWSIAQGNGGFVKFAIVLIIIVSVMVVVVYIEQSQRRIPVQYAKQSIAGRTVGGGDTYLPMKLNMSGVIPIIFASSILALPGLIAKFGDQNAGWVQWINQFLANQTSWVHITFYALLIIFFCFFYTSITFNPDEISDNMKNQGGFIPGIRAGTSTADYLRYVLYRVNTAGSLYLMIVALVPTILILVLGLSQSLPFGGTTILIIVGVGLETVRQINSQLQQHHYDGFLS
ncbi:MAG: preprotein translocase subunit SecY [Bifidobacteriaceae bacterium]|jgi:preprotein translocase subunit SecY|nr:preprotein translocase subunit SecY [Bifidobacteriaceae bacterium]